MNRPVSPPEFGWLSRIGRTLRFGRLAFWARVSNFIVGQSQRLLDLILLVPVLVLSAPLWALALLLYRPLRIRLQRTTIVGLRGKRVDLLSWVSPRPGVARLLAATGLRNLPVIANLIRGDLSFVGPRAVGSSEAGLTQKVSRQRFDVRPGLICLWWLRQRTSIDYETEFETDKEYVESRSLTGDLGIILRSILALFYGGGNRAGAETINILDIRIDNLTMAGALERIQQMLNSDGCFQVSFVNPHCANVAQEDETYLKALQQADLNLIDGIGMRIAGKILRSEIAQNVNGTDLFPRLCSQVSGTGKRVYFLGAQPGIPDRVAEWVRQRYPEVEIAGFHHGYFTPEEEGQVIDGIRQARADLLFVAFGVPRQDIWIAQNLERTGVRVGIGVGGLFDFYSGNTARAPQWLRELGLEWIFRFYQEPGRLWKRYFVGNAVFLARVFRQALQQTSGKQGTKE
ncbi:MAG: WecB/TagA/CpsF family glycosyltransferase [Acidobacteriota bacterium]|nr:MAG: WecB/TagA/CpsF family glycosyltransferase [Acidobacteriota bacterium]